MLLLFCSTNSNAQVCTGDIKLEAQSDVDNFNINYPSCTEIDGNILITGADITDISPLSQIEKVVGDFEIINCQNLLTISDTDLNVQGSIRIVDNESLNDINGFNSTDSLKTLNIFENPILISTKGFEALRVVSDSLHIDSNDSLKSIPFFNSIEYISYLEIDRNSIDSVYGFNKLDSIELLFITNVQIINGFHSLRKAGTIFISSANTNGIHRIQGFNNVERMTGTLSFGSITQSDPITIFNKVRYIENLVLHTNGGEFKSLMHLEEVGNNRMLLRGNFQNLDFLSNMRRMGGFKPFIRIEDCPNLTDISGLDGIDPETVNWFWIRRNENLNICHSNLVCAVLERGDNDPPSIWIDNGPGCNNTEEILEQCDDKPDEPEEDPTLCPITSRPGMQIDRVDDDNYNIMYHYGIKRMYLRDVKYIELIDLIEYHKVEKELLFDFDTFALERYCERAEKISLGESYEATLPTDPKLQYRVDRTMSELDFFSNFVLTLGDGECVKL